MEREERGIKILKFEMKWIRPKIYTKKTQLNKSRRYRESIENKNSIDREVQEGIELLLKSLKQGFQGGEAAQDECNQDRHQNKQSKSMLSIETHPQLQMQSNPRSNAH